MEIIQKFVRKFRLDRFFSSKLILAIDMLVSAGASVCTLIFVRFLLSSHGLTPLFVFGWLGLSLILSFVYFFLFRTYRTIIRHSTIREFAKICVASFLKSLSVCLIVYFLPFDHQKEKQILQFHIQIYLLSCLYLLLLV